MVVTDPLAKFLECLEKLPPLASEVAAQRDRTIEQETTALKKILEKIKPLLEITAYNIQVGYYSSGQQFSKTHAQYHDLKGLILIDNFEKECTDRDTRGDYSGWQLVLFADGRLVTLERSGEWSRWQGESSCWNIVEEEELSAETAVRRYGLKDVMEGLASELTQAFEKLKKKQADYEERLKIVQKVREAFQ